MDQPLDPPPPARPMRIPWAAAGPIIGFALGAVLAVLLGGVGAMARLGAVGTALGVLLGAAIDARTGPGRRAAE